MKRTSRALLAITLAFGASLSTAQTAASRPNIVLLLADDLGYSDLGSYGSEIATPNIDALARSGVRFSNYHTPASCAPTRAMLMTGLDSHRAGVANMSEAIPAAQSTEPGYGGVLLDSAITVATRLKDTGYHTYMTGKWHLGKQPGDLPNDRGFERSFALGDTGADNWDNKSYLPPYVDANWFEDGVETDLPDDFYSSEFLVDKAIEYIDSNDDGQPFFSYVAFQAVHIPVQAPREYTEKYLDSYDGGWASLRQARYAGSQREGISKPGIEMQEMPTTQNWEALSEEEKRYQRKRMAVYAGMIEAMDFHVGRLIDHLKAIGEYNNTVFIFASDNGAEPSAVDALGGGLIASYVTNWMESQDYSYDYEIMGEQGSYSFIGASYASAAVAPLSWYKFFAGEGGMRVPLIVAGLDNMPRGVVSDAFSWATDIVPTLLEIAGADPDDSRYEQRNASVLEGHSLLPLLQGTADRVYQENEVVGYELGGNAALFRGPYKIMKNRGPTGDDQWHLYNIVTDPAETNDLREAEPELFASLLQAYAEYEVEYRVLPVSEDYDQRRQVFLNGLTYRYGSTVQAVVLSIVLLVMLFFLRRHLIHKRAAS